ncbi:eCIS core domain-containing protein, partial [Coleofasciculus sp.]|uniref:eCIS core domain-containing protein n=1 Tax=Coleofasciculus sp. TaxID=3100458 RepID=UPI0039F7E8BF
ELKMKPLADSIQRQEEEEKEELKMKPLVQRQSSGGGMAATPELEQSIASARGSGQPIADEVRQPMEQAFGADFSGVKIHTDSKADQLNRSVGARAFTTGQDVFFRQGEYNPGSKDGQELMAHEFTHVLQQSGGVQSKLSDTSTAELQPKCSACEIEEKRKKEQQAIQAKLVGNTIQPDLLDDASEAVGNFVEGVSNWIDLLGPKQDLLTHLTDPSWIVNSVTEVANQNEANPKHSFFMSMGLYGVGIGVGAEAMTYVQRIRNCDTRAQVDGLREEFDGWKAERQSSLQEELEAKVEEYREVERSWLENFGTAASVTQDPVHPNQSQQDVALSLLPGVPEAKVVVETRVNCNFQRTSQAMQDNDGDGNPDIPDWTDDERTHFMDQFQKQLNDVWSTGASGTAPFRCSQPADYLLTNESPKWSEITANMEAQVTLDPANPHFQLDVFKEAPGENNRAHVGTNTGVFYMEDADAGYKTLGPDVGQPTGAQHTLAHEWHHMIGNPDEYAENSADQSGNASTPTDLQSRWGDCQQNFQDIINDPASTPEQKQQAQQDLQALRDHASDVDSSTPGFQSGIFPLAGRDDIPDDCFAIRGVWRPTDGPQVLLQPGAQSQRGGTNISASAEDAARLSDRGNQVRPYMREGIVQELPSMLEGRFDPEVSFDHNFQDMTPEQTLETLQARIQNVLHDISDLGSSHEPPGEGIAPDHTEGNEHGHTH